MAKNRAASVKIIDNNDSDEIREFSNVKLTLTEKRSVLKLIIKVPPDEEIELNLKNCSYMEDSSIPGKIECIYDKSENQTVTIRDREQQCVQLLNEMRDYLRDQGKSPSPDHSPSPPRRHSPSPRRRSPSPRRRSPSPRRRSPSPRRRSPPTRRRSPSPSPQPTRKVTELIEALNKGQAEEAATIAGELARAKQPARFALDMVNESGNTPPTPPPPPPEKPLTLKLSIESFLIENNDNQTYDVTIFPSTTIKDLKEIVQQNANISPDQQYWYINRELLSNTYKFNNEGTPKVNDQTVLILYITKPQTA